MQHRADLAQFHDPEHLALSTDREYALPGTSDDVIRTAQTLSHQIVALRTAIGRELWARQIFIDAEILEELIFYVAREGHGAEPVIGVLEWIRDAERDPTWPNDLPPPLTWSARGRPSPTVDGPDLVQQPKPGVRSHAADERT